MRSEDKHTHYCDLVEGDTTGRVGYSSTYGVNGRTILMDLPYFEITKCLPFDVMHTVFEGTCISHLNMLFELINQSGVVPLALNQLFIHIIDDNKYLSLDQLNHAIQTFGYGFSDMATKPAIIYQQSGSKNYTIKQKGIYRSIHVLIITHKYHNK